MARIIIGYSCCEKTAQAFAAHDHDVWTCDLLESRGWLNHLQCDVWEAIERNGPWDFGVFHPMCTYLTCSAAWAFSDPDYENYPGVGYHQRVKPGTLTGEARREARRRSLDNFSRLLELPFPVAIENPGTSFVSKAIRPPSQIVQPYQFGDDASKATGFWLSDGVPPLNPTLYHSARMVCACGVTYRAHVGHSATCPSCGEGEGAAKPRWANQTDSGQNRLSPSATRWLERSATYPGIAAAVGDQWGRWLNQGVTQP